MESRRQTQKTMILEVYIIIHKFRKVGSNSVSGLFCSLIPDCVDSFNL